MPAFRPIVPDGRRRPAPTAGRSAVGGQSYGGRVASLAAAEPDTDYAALVLFSYPLHPPGAPGQGRGADRPLAGDPCPVLLLSGESDPFARLDLLRARVAAPARRRAGDVSRGSATR